MSQWKLPFHVRSKCCHFTLSPQRKNTKPGAELIYKSLTISLKTFLKLDRKWTSGLTYKLDLQEFPSRWLGAVSVFVSVCVVTENPALANIWILALSGVGTEVCVGVCWCCWWTCQSPDSSNTPLSSATENKKLTGIYTFTLAHESPRVPVPFPSYLCRISSVLMTVIDTLINMFIALIIITIIRR